MNPHRTAKDPEPSASKVTPFEQIATVEEGEENRANETLARMEQEERDAKKLIAKTESEEESRLDEETDLEIRDYAEKEPAAVLAESARKMEKELASIEASFNRRGDSIAATLAESIVDFSPVITR